MGCYCRPPPPVLSCLKISPTCIGKAPIFVPSAMPFLFLVALPPNRFPSTNTYRHSPNRAIAGKRGYLVALDASGNVYLLLEDRFQPLLWPAGRRCHQIVDASIAVPKSQDEAIKMWLLTAEGHLYGGRVVRTDDNHFELDAKLLPSLFQVYCTDKCQSRLFLRLL